MKKFNLLTITFLSLFTINATGQNITRSIICTAAERFIEDNYSIDFCIGEPVTGLMLSGLSNTFINAGYIQPTFEIENGFLNPGSLLVFPNPASGSSIQLLFNIFPEGNYHMLLFNVPGQIFQSIDINYKPGASNYISLNVSMLKAGIYFIKMFDNKFSAEVQFVKIN